MTTTQMPSATLTPVIFSATGFLTGETATSANYQPHKLTLRAGCYALHLPSGKAGRINNIAYQQSEEMGRLKYTKVFGIAYDSEYDSTVLRRITPAQYRALPKECKIVSPETGIF